MCKRKYSRNPESAVTGVRALLPPACLVEWPPGSRSSEDHLR
jgi:hypothetical protein